MRALKGFQIPLVGLDDGKHSYTFEITPDFFLHFENEDFQESRFEVQIDLDRHTDMFVLQFEIKGSINTSCDRCTASIELPIDGRHRLIIKMALGESADPEIEHISPETHHLDVDRLIYEYILMSLPMVHRYECEKEKPKPCDEVALRALEQAAGKSDSGIWDELKNLEVDN